MALAKEREMRAKFQVGVSLFIHNWNKTGRRANFLVIDPKVVRRISGSDDDRFEKLNVST